eukprot:1324502-Rhodomonas_salina.5
MSKTSEFWKLNYKGWFGAGKARLIGEATHRNHLGVGGCRNRRDSLQRAKSLLDGSCAVFAGDLVALPQPNATPSA